MKERERIASNMIDKKYCFLWLVSAPPPFSTSFFSQVHFKKKKKKKVRSVVHLVTHACTWDVPVRKHLLSAHTCLNSSWPRDSCRLTAGRGCQLQENDLWPCKAGTHGHCSTPWWCLVTLHSPPCALLSIYTIPTWISRDSDLCQCRCCRCLWSIIVLPPLFIVHTIFI